MCPLRDPGHNTDRLQHNVQAKCRTFLQLYATKNILWSQEIKARLPNRQLRLPQSLPQNATHVQLFKMRQG